MNTLRTFAARHPVLHGIAIGLTVAAIFVVSFDLVGLLP